MIEYKAVKQYSFDDSWTIFRKVTFWKFVWYQEIWEWSDMLGKRLPIITTKPKADIIIHCLTRRYGCTYQWRTLDYRNRLINPWE